MTVFHELIKQLPSLTNGEHKLSQDGITIRVLVMEEKRIEVVQMNEELYYQSRRAARVYDVTKDNAARLHQDMLKDKRGFKKPPTGKPKGRPKGCPASITVCGNCSFASNGLAYQKIHTKLCGHVGVMTEKMLTKS